MIMGVYIAMNTVKTPCHSIMIIKTVYVVILGISSIVNRSRVRLIESVLGLASSIVHIT